MSHDPKISRPQNRPQKSLALEAMVSLRLAPSELELLHTVIRNDVACGAEDPAFHSILKKLIRLREQTAKPQSGD